MRIHGDEKHPDYSQYAALHAKVFLNGERQNFCLFADDDAGVIERYLLNEEGKPYLKGDELAKETVRGKVEIRLPPDAHKFM